ncbi:MAG TPA: TPM domain-containing protein, partial [Candidatus Baltobacteraceae bacterium]
MSLLRRLTGTAFIVIAGIALALVCSRAARAGDSAIPPKPVLYVTDNAGALSSTVRDALEGELQSYEKQTAHQVIVWIGQTTGDDALEDWTSTVAQSWGVGHKGKDDGVVLFLFMQDRKVRIEVGYGLEGDLTDAAAAGIIRNDITPYMR